MLAYREMKTTFHSAASADANGTITNCSGMSAVVVQITGTFTTAVVYWEGSVDESNYVGVQGTNLNTGAVATSATATGLYQIPVLGFRRFRARLDWTSGTSITVVGIFTQGPPVPLNDIDVAATETVAVSTINSVAPQFDTTDRMAVSVYGKSSAAGDKEVLVNSLGNTLIATYGTTISQTPTVTAGAYSANDAVGGLLTFANAARVSAGGGVITDVSIVDDAGQDAELELWLFNQTFTAMSDKTAWAPSEADLENWIGTYSTSSSTWRAAGTPSTVHIKEIMRYDLTGTSLFGQLVTRGTPTYAATDDVTVKVKLLQD